MTTIYIDSLPNNQIDKFIEEVRQKLPEKNPTGRIWGLLLPALLRRIDELQKIDTRS